MAGSLLLLVLVWAGCDLGEELDGVLPVQGSSNTNTPPVAVAGEDRRCRLGDRLWFDGSRSYDPDGRIIGHEWDFGDGSSPVREAVVQHVYSAAGEYVATLRVMDDRGGIAEDDVRVIVSAEDQQQTLNGVGCENNQPPVAHAGDNRYVYIGNQPVSVAFDGGGSYDPDSGQPIAEYNWDFGNGLVGSGQTPSTTYRDSGTYIVTLLVKDNCGEWSPTAATCRVFVSANSCGDNRSPVALASFSPSLPVACQPVSFSAANSYDPDTGQSLAYTWSFGDGGTATGLNVTYSYPNTGTYYATLTVTDPCGASDSRTVTVTVRPNNLPNANAGGNKNGTACQPVTFNGSNSWDPDAGQTLTHTWNFGDGSPVESGAIVTHAYSSPGTYTVRLTVTDNCGASAVATVYATIYAAGPCQCNQSPTANAGPDKTGTPGQPVTLNGSGSDPDAGQTLTYSWTSGHGQTANTPNATFTYNTAGTYTATLTVSDGCVSVSDTAVVTISPADPCAGNRPPVANAGPDKTGYVGELISFSGSGSSDPDSGQVLTYSWNFGDGSPTASGVNVSHSYGAVGTYTVTLTVTDPCGATATDTAVVTVPNRPPVANAGPDKSGYVGQAITFNGSGSDPDAGQTLTYSWTSGHGQTANTPNATFTYDTPGTYTATLTVRDPHNAAATDTALATITVQDPCAGNRPPVASPVSTRYGVACAPVSFSGNGSDPDGQTLSYFWNFGNGQTANTQYASVTYSTAGNYNVTFTVTDPCGASHSVYTTAVISAHTATANAGPDKTGTAGQAISFSGSASSFPNPGQPLTYSWTSGHGETANGQNVSFTYATPGTYTVTLTVTEQAGCASATDTAVVTVNPADPCAGNRPPVANAGPDKTGYVGELISFSGSGSSDPDSGQVLTYSWNFGDGSPTASGVNVSHSFGAVGTYTVTLTVADPCGASATDTAVVTVPNRPPTADAGPDRAGYVGQAITFNGSGSDPDAGQTLTYSWTSGHGQTANTPNATFTYDTPGTYTVTLTVSDSCGASATDTAVATVTGGQTSCEGNQPPVANAGPDQSGIVGQLLSFSGSGSSDPEGGALTYSWNFGDGSPTASGASVSHAYDSAGTYTVALKVTDPCGSFTADRATVTITDTNGPLTARFFVEKLVEVDADGVESWVPCGESADDPIESGLRVRLNGTYSTGPIAMYSWRKDGQSAGTGGLLFRQYTGPATFTLKLGVADGQGGVNWSAEKTIYVSPGPQLLSSTPYPGAVFRPQLHTLVGTRVWAISQSGLIGTADLANPAALPALAIMPVPVLSEKYSIAHANGRLCVAVGSGVNVYTASPSDFNVAKFLSAADLGVAGQSICNAAAAGDYLYAIAGTSNQLVVVDLSNLPLVGSSTFLSLGSVQVNNMLKVGEKAIVLWRSGGSTLVLVDVRVPANPVVAEVKVLPQSVLLDALASLNRDRFAVNSTAGGQMSDLLIPVGGGGSLTLATPVTLPSQTAYAGLGQTRLYAPWADKIRKYDIADPAAGYLMQTFDPDIAGTNSNFLLDPDGPLGPLPDHLFVGYDFGFRAYSP